MLNGPANHAKDLASKKEGIKKHTAPIVEPHESVSARGIEEPMQQRAIWVISGYQSNLKHVRDVALE